MRGYRKILALVAVLLAGVALELYKGLSDSSTMFLIGVLGAFVAGNSVNAVTAIKSTAAKPELDAIQGTLEEQNSFLARTEDVAGINSLILDVKNDVAALPKSTDTLNVKISELAASLGRISEGGDKTLAHVVTQLDATLKSQQDVMAAQLKMLAMQKDTNDGLMYIARQLGVQGNK